MKKLILMVSLVSVQAVSALDRCGEIVNTESLTPKQAYIVLENQTEEFAFIADAAMAHSQRNIHMDCADKIDRLIGLKLDLLNKHLTKITN